MWDWCRIYIPVRDLQCVDCAKPFIWKKDVAEARLSPNLTRIVCISCSNNYVTRVTK